MRVRRGSCRRRPRWIDHCAPASPTGMACRASRTRALRRAPRIGESLAPNVQEPLRELGLWSEFLALMPLPSWGTRICGAMQRSSATRTSSTLTVVAGMWTAGRSTGCWRAAPRLRAPVSWKAWPCSASRTEKAAGGCRLHQAAARLLTADPAGDVWRSCSGAAFRYSRADIAAAWPMRANRRSRAIGRSAERRSLGCSSAAGRASSIPFLASRQECIGEPFINSSTRPQRRRSAPWP